MLDNEEREFLSVLQSLADLYVKARRDALRQSAIKEAELQVLTFLYDYGRSHFNFEPEYLTFKELQEKMWARKQETSRIAISLQEKGLIKVWVNGKDKRSRKLSLSSKGSELASNFDEALLAKIMNECPAIRAPGKITKITRHLRNAINNL